MLRFWKRQDIGETYEPTWENQRILRKNYYNEKISGTFNCSPAILACCYIPVTQRKHPIAWLALIEAEFAVRLGDQTFTQHRLRLEVSLRNTLALEIEGPLLPSWIVW